MLLPANPHHALDLALIFAWWSGHGAVSWQWGWCRKFSRLLHGGAVEATRRMALAGRGTSGMVAQLGASRSCLPTKELGPIS